MKPPRLPTALLAGLFWVTASSALAADLNIQNPNAPGFTDPSPTTPLLLNFGTTRGDQALIVFQAAGAMWGATVKSTVPILIDSQFDTAAQNATFVCSPQGLVLAFTQPDAVYTSPNFPNTSAGYVITLANALSGTDLGGGNPQFTVNINAGLGTAACNFPASWYFGLDSQIPDGSISLFTTLMHEFGHGLGFISLVDPNDGSANPLSIFDFHIIDVAQGIPWTSDNAAQRQSLAHTPSAIAFDGPAVTADIPTYLAPVPTLNATFQATTTQLSFAEGEFSGPLVGTAPLAAAEPLDACSDLTNASQVSGKFALIERSFADAGVVCTFLSKAERAADAGAVGVIVFDDVQEALIEMAGTPAQSIPATFISNQDGTTLQTELGQGPVTISFGTGALPSNTDPTGTRVLLYTPTVVSGGSSVSHWNANSYPHTLMLEYANQPDIRLNMDFTPDVMSDLGWEVVNGLTVSVVKLLDPEVPAGGQFSYIIAVLNRRKTAVSGATLDLALPPGTTFISNASNPAGCATEFPCALAPMQPGDVQLVVTTVTAPLSATSPFVATATLTPATPDSDDNLTASSSQTVATGGDLQVTVSGHSPVTAGQETVITTVITNAGPGDAAGVVLNGVVTGTGVVPTFANNTENCTSGFPCTLRTMPAGTSLTIYSGFNVPAGFANGATFTATATAATPDSNTANNSAAFVFSTTSGGGGGCSTTGGPTTLGGLLGVCLALILRKRRDTF